MPTPRRPRAACGISVALLLLVVAAQAQPTQVILGRNNENVQTAESTVVPNPAPTGPTYGGPFGFLVGVSGTGLSAPTIVFPAGTSNATLNPSQHNGGVLGFNAEDGEWQYGSPNFNNVATTTGAERNTRFPLGTYTVQIPDYSDVTLNLSAPTGLLAPVFALSGGTWSNGVYLVNPTQAVTISTLAVSFTGFSQNANGAISFEILGQSGPPIVEDLRFYADDTGAPNFINYTIAADTLTLGQNYSVFGSYIAIVDQNSTNGSFNAAFFEVSTEFIISAIPEPSTYALLVGLGALAIAARRRRRWQAA